MESLLTDNSENLASSPETAVNLAVIKTKRTYYVVQITLKPAIYIVKLQCVCLILSTSVRNVSYQKH